MKTPSQTCLKPLFEKTVMYMIEKIPDIEKYLNSIEWKKDEYAARAKEYRKLINGLEVVAKRLKTLEANAKIMEQLADE